MLKYILLYRHAVLISFVSGLALYLVQKFPLWWLFLVILIVWAGSFILLSLHLSKKNQYYKENLALGLFTIFAVVGLLVLTEWQALRYLIVLFGAFGMGLLSAFPVYRSYADKYDLKSWRRVRMMIWVFDLYAMTTLVFAFSMLFDQIPFFVYAILGTLVFSWVSVSIWQMYFEKKAKVFLPWVIILGIVMLEMIWVTHFFPWGYLVLGFLVTWLWYIMHLLVRFHLTKQGIKWKKQKWFLINNIVLYIIFLIFIVRWI